MRKDIIFCIKVTYCKNIVELERYRNKLGTLLEFLKKNMALFYDRNKTRVMFQVNLAQKKTQVHLSTRNLLDLYLEHVASLILSARWNISRGYFEQKEFRDFIITANRY